MRSDYQLPSTCARSPFAAGIICRVLVGSMLAACLIRVAVVIAGS